MMDTFSETFSSPAATFVFPHYDKNVWASILAGSPIIVTSRGKLLSLLFDVVVLLLITTGTLHSHIRACGLSAITHGMLSHMRSG